MKEIKYNDVAINVPENWADVKLKDYESFYKIRPKSAREKGELLAKICGIEPEILLEWPAEVFDIIVDASFFLWEERAAPPKASIELEGTLYVIAVEEKLALGAYLDALEAQKEGQPRVLSNVLAIVCRPAGEAYNPDLTNERVEMWGEVDMDRIQPLLAFFLHCSAVLERRTTAFTALHQAVGSLPQNILNLHGLGAGIRWWQIWRLMKFGILTVSLRRQLRKFSRSYSTNEIKVLPKKRRGTWIKNWLK